MIKINKLFALLMMFVMVLFISSCSNNSISNYDNTDNNKLNKNIEQKNDSNNNQQATTNDDEKNISNIKDNKKEDNEFFSEAPSAFSSELELISVIEAFKIEKVKGANKYNMEKFKKKEFDELHTINYYYSPIGIPADFTLSIITATPGEINFSFIPQSEENIPYMPETGIFYRMRRKDDTLDDFINQYKPVQSEHSNKYYFHTGFTNNLQIFWKKGNNVFEIMLPPDMVIDYNTEEGMEEIEKLCQVEKIMVN